MKTQLSGGLALRPSSGQAPTKYYGRAKDALPSKGTAWRGWITNESGYVAHDDIYVEVIPVEPMPPCLINQ